MQADWFRRCKTDEEKKRIQDLVLGSSRVLDELKEILLSRLKEVESFSKKDFEDPNWGFRVACEKGETKVLKDVIKLITLTKE